MESRYSMTEYVDADMTSAEVLEEKSYLARGEWDFALEEYVLSLTEVQELLLRTNPGNAEGLKPGAVPVREAAVLFSDWTENGWSVTDLSVINGNSVYISFSKEDETEVLTYCFFADSSCEMQKGIGVYSGDDVKAVYLITDGVARKSIPKRQWFYWITRFMEA